MSSRRPRAPSYRSQSSYSSGYSDASDQSYSTAPTVYSERPYTTSTSKHGQPMITGPVYNVEGFLEDEADPRSSTDTYASTIPSDEDLPEIPDYEVAQERPETFPSNAIPSTPPEFADLFPSKRRLLIRHDDSTADGNMNLRVDTEVHFSRHRPRTVTLFHLKMNDLHDREFSLRRYCRTSGREVCHSRRKYDQSSVSKRPIIQRSLSSALQTMKLKPAMKRSNTADLPNEGEENEGLAEFVKGSEAGIQPKVPTNIMKLEFSNYAHVNITRRSAKSSKRYDFEYWGVKYQWKRDSRREGDARETSYHLINLSTSTAIAHIRPERLTRQEALEEQYKGGWVPPSSLWISDKRLFKTSPDLPDIIVSTGLMSLVDDCIDQHWHNRRRLQLDIPVESPHKSMGNYIGPKRLVDEVFNRQRDTESHRSISRQHV